MPTRSRGSAVIAHAVGPGGASSSPGGSNRKEEGGGAKGLELKGSCTKKWPQSILPFVNFIFSHYEIRVRGGGVPPPMVVSRSNTSLGKAEPSPALGCPRDPVSRRGRREVRWCRAICVGVLPPPLPRGGASRGAGEPRKAKGGEKSRRAPRWEDGSGGAHSVRVAPDSQG